MSLLSFCEWLANTPGSIALHESLWGYAIVESTHVLTLCLFLGMVVVLDLRLVGVTLQRVPVSEVAGRLLPWAGAGFVVMVISGALLFYAIPVRTFHSIFFRFKLVMLIAAGVNVWVFHSRVFRSVAEWDLVPSRRKGPGWRAPCLWCSGPALSLWDACAGDLSGGTPDPAGAPLAAVPG